MRSGTKTQGLGVLHFPLPQTNLLEEGISKLLHLILNPQKAGPESQIIRVGWPVILAIEGEKKKKKKKKKKVDVIFILK